MVVTTTPFVRIERLRKEFGAVVALEEVTLDVNPGDIVALVGDNGAGKSTVVKCLAGVSPPTSGQILLEGQPVHFSSPLDARSQGIEVVFQDLALANAQPVYMNMFLGRELVKGPLRRLDRKTMAAETQKLLEELDVRVDSPQKTIRDLSGWAARGCDRPRRALGAAARTDGRADRRARRCRNTARRRPDSPDARPGPGDPHRQPLARPGVPARRPDLRPPTRKAGRHPSHL